MRENLKGSPTLAVVLVVYSVVLVPEFLFLVYGVFDLLSVVHPDV